MKKQFLMLMFGATLCTMNTAFAMNSNDSDKLATAVIQPKGGVKKGTIEFVEAVYSGNSFNKFTYGDAQEAFTDLKCNITTKNAREATSLPTHISYVLDEIHVEQFTYHASRNHKKNLPHCLKPLFKRFLNAINKTPENLL